MSSRRSMPGREVGSTIVVGWDNPLMTFFAQVFGTAEEGEIGRRCVFWIGDSPRAITIVEDLARQLQPFGVLPPDLQSQLKADRAADLDRGPTELQRRALAWIGGRP